MMRHFVDMPSLVTLYVRVWIETYLVEGRGRLL